MRPLRMNPFTTVTAMSALLLMGAGIPALASETDHKIVSAAQNSYNFKTYLADDAVRIECSGGVVTLTGTVAVAFHRDLAESTVASLPGVRKVDNQITITGTQPVAQSDDWITLKVVSTLAFHKNVSATGTEVHTAAGVVTLKGIAENGAARELAAEYAQDVEGVLAVHNEMTLSPSPQPHHETVGATIDDTSITAQIKTTLLFHKSTRALATKVITKEGNVSLHGEAKTLAEKEQVTRLAEDIKGVRHVSNHMTIAKS